MGDEQGTLWLVNRTGVVAQSFTLPGSLRHSPLVVGNWLLMHVQTFDGSELMGMHVDHLTVEVGDTMLTGLTKVPEAALTQLVKSVHHFLTTSRWRSVIRCSRD